MSNKQITNPLYSPQREKTGARTKDKYDYQYHWALYRVISTHNDKNEYAVFVELHEDVVVADSLDSSKAKFEFNQVKTTKGKFTTNKLTKKTNNKSVLGKLISSCNGKSYQADVSCLNLVTPNGFSLKLKEEGIDLDKIAISDLEEQDLNKLEQAIRQELGISKLPSNLQFIVSDLTESAYQRQLIGDISTLVNRLKPGSMSNSIDIYQLLIDEINKKGKITVDFKNWDDVLDKKALTSITVTNVINDCSNLKDDSIIIEEFNEICNELELSVIKRRTLRQEFDRYRRQRISNGSSREIKIKSDLKNKITTQLKNGIEDFNVLLKEVSENLDSILKAYFSGETAINAAIICEFIMQKDE